MLTSLTRRTRTATILALAAALTVAAPAVDARPGGGASMGSRGSRTFSPPSATTTAPTAAPMQRTQTQPSPGMTNPGMQAPAARPRFGGGFMAGLLGAGLLGALLGGGFFGGLGGIASMLGLLLQVGLVVLLASLALRWFRRRNQPAGAGASYARTGMDADPGLNGGPGAGGPAAGLGGMMGGAPRPPQQRPVQVGPNDFQSFERLLGEVQDAYSHEDAVGLRNLATPEMAGYFEEELRNNAARGVVNRITEVKLQQGDLSEAWGEGNQEFATVAMRYTLKDVTLDRTSNRVVATEPGEAVELWTFVRSQGRPWILSAIQQTR
ncbi:TIM44-like domain-containing protein [uncultured Methylobacterium sp.]|uniref:TIM44-like domain-containing protein n=1 Tax=uncultured Methylobacterium sp. TaxID=157278 RepID=UPI0035CB10B1